MALIELIQTLLLEGNTQRFGTIKSDDADSFEERAAIMEFEGNQSRSKAEKVAHDIQKNGRSYEN